MEPLWAVLYTLEQDLWPDGRCDRGDRCQQWFCAPGHWGTVLLLAGTRAECTAPHRDHKERPSGDILVLDRGCSASTTWLCLQNQLLKAKISPKGALKPNAHENVFCVFFLYDAHGFCYKHYPSVSKKDLDGKLLTGFQIISSPCFILSWLPGLHYLLHRVSSYVMGDDSSQLLMVLYNTFTFLERCLLKSNSMALFCGLEKPSQMGRTGWLMRLWWSSWQWITENSDKNKQCFLALGSSSAVCRFSKADLWKAEAWNWWWQLWLKGHRQWGQGGLPSTAVMKLPKYLLFRFK